MPYDSGQSAGVVQRLLEVPVIGFVDITVGIVFVLAPLFVWQFVVCLRRRCGIGAALFRTGAGFLGGLGIMTIGAGVLNVVLSGLPSGGVCLVVLFIALLAASGFLQWRVGRPPPPVVKEGDGV